MMLPFCLDSDYSIILFKFRMTDYKEILQRYIKSSQQGDFRIHLDSRKLYNRFE